MNMPNIGDHIIVRCNNGMMDLKYLHKIYPVTGTDTHFPTPYEPGSAVLRMDPCPVVRFNADGNPLYTTKWEVVPKIGDKVRATAGLADNRYYGQTCTVSEVIPNEIGVVIRGEFTSLQKPDDTILLGFYEWMPADAPEVKPSEDASITTDLQTQVDRLTAQNRVLLTTIANWEQDWTTVTDALHNEADRRGWCNEYDEFVNEVESDLRIGVMPRRVREYVVSWTTTVMVNVPMSRTYTAISEENAEQMARDDYYTNVETQEVLDAVRDGNWEESDDSYREYEVEEA